MARIDPLLQALKQHGGDKLLVASGQQVSLSINNKLKPMTSKQATRQQVQAFYQEIAPAGVKQALEQDGTQQFSYASPIGPLQVKVSRSGDSLQMEVTPEPAGQAPATEAPATKAPPVAAPAPPKVAAPPPDTATPPQAIAPPPATPEPLAPIPLAAPPALPVAAVPAKPRPASPVMAKGGAPAIEALFQQMIDNGCSDLHMSTGNPPLYRKDGDIVSLEDQTVIEADAMREYLLAITPERNRIEFEESCDSDFSYEMKGARFRCNLFMDRLGMGGVFRIIPSDIPSFEDLNLPKQLLKLCHLNKGLVVVTGPTGSGKSTTLAAMIDYINKNLNAHIITIEDPVEFVHPKHKCLINQREVHVHTKGFKNALRAALREDPDIVLVGEMRDLETVAIAIETAETGHLVFGTLHTNTAPSTVDRIIDQFAADRQSQVRTMLAESLKGVVAQCLLRKIGGGRVAAQEILMVTSAISNLIREGKTFQIPSMMQTGRGMGMITMNDALVELVKNKKVEPEEAYIKAVQKGEFLTLLKRHNIKIQLPSEDGAPAAPAVESPGGSS